MLRFQRKSLKNLLFSLICSVDLFRLYILFSQHRACANTQEALSFLFFFIKRSACNIFMLACALFNEQNKRPILLSISTWFVLGKQNVQSEKGLFSMYNLIRNHSTKGTRRKMFEKMSVYAKRGYIFTYQVWNGAPWLKDSTQLITGRCRRTTNTKDVAGYKGLCWVNRQSELSKYRLD